MKVMKVCITIIVCLIEVKEWNMKGLRGSNTVSLDQGFPNFFSLLPNLTLDMLPLLQNVNIDVYGWKKTLDIFSFVTPLLPLKNCYITPRLETTALDSLATERVPGRKITKSVRE